MSKQRYVSTKFWQDNYIIDKDPIEKLLFLYLLTNPLTNILGIYEISIKIIAFDTGIDSEMVLKILERFEKDNKVKYFKGYIALKNFTKHQKDNPKINKGIEILISETPLELLSWVNIDRKRFNLPDSLYIDYGKTMNYSNSNSNINSNSNSNSNVNIKYISQTFDKFDPIYKLTTYLEEKIMENNKAVRKRTESQIQSWCKDMDKLIRIDKAIPNEIKKIIDWVVKDRFWSENILCAEKLRKHYPSFYKIVIDNNIDHDNLTDLDEWRRKIEKEGKTY